MMHTQAVIGLDIGTSSTKAILVDATGHVHASAQRERAVSTPHPGHFEHDADSIWWADTCDIAREIMANCPPDIAVTAVGLSCYGPCLLLLDEHGCPLRPAILYGVDTRASAQVDELSGQFPSHQALARFGMPFTSQSVAPKIMWIRENEHSTFQRAAALVNTNGYLAFRLTGELAVDHHQAAYMAPIYEAGRWSPDQDLVAPDLLPRLRWSGDIVGRVTRDAHDQTTLPVGIPVVLGSSDGLTDAVGAGVQDPGSAVVRFGTTVGLTTITQGSVRSTSVWPTPGCRPGETALVGGLSTGGAITTWFREVFAHERSQSTQADISRVFADLTAEAELSPPGANGLTLLPHFAGERTPSYDPGARGVLIGLTLATTRGDLYRAVLEGTAFAVRHLVEEMAAAGAPITRLRSVGGATRQHLWMQIVSSVTGLTQELMTPSLGAPLGAARLAAEATGLATPTADAWVVPSEVFSPNVEDAAIYDSLYANYRCIYSRTRDLLAPSRPSVESPVLPTNQ